jgi:Tfp pilus assembly protein PilF
MNQTKPWIKAGIPLVLLLVVAVVFSNSLEIPFVLDDKAKIVNNPDIRNVSDVLSRLFHAYHPGDLGWTNDPSRPLVSILFAWLYQLGQGTHDAFHLFSIVVHAINVLLVYFLLIVILRSRSKCEEPETTALAFAGSLLFAILPIQAGTVIYAYGLSDLLTAFSVFSCLLLYVSSDRLSPLKLTALTLLFAAGLASKQLTIILPAVLFAADYLIPPPSGRIRWRPILYFSGICGVYLLVRLWRFGSIGDVEAQRVLQDVTLGQYLYLQPLVWVRYLWLTFVPTGLTIDHALGPTTYASYWFYLSWIAWTLILGLLAKKLLSARGSSRGEIFGVIFYLIWILPVSSFFPTTDALVERRIYGANFGLLMSLLWILPPYRRRLNSWFLGILLSLILGGYSARSYLRNAAFHDPEKIWQESLSSYPGNSRALNNLAIYYSTNGKTEEAILYFEKQLELKADSPEPLNNLGMIYGNSTSRYFDARKASDYFRRSFEAVPSHAYLLPLQNLAFMNLNQGNIEEGEKVLLEILAYQPAHEPSRLAWIEVLIHKNEIQRAIQELELAERVLQPSPKLRELRERLSQITSRQETVPAQRHDQPQGAKQDH